MAKATNAVAKRSSKKFVENTIQGVRYAMRNGHYYFSLSDTARKFGYKTTQDAKKLCRRLEDGIPLSNGQFAITFDDLLQLSKGARELPDDFIDALQNEVSLNREEAANRIAGNHPDFSNPAEAARAWAEIYERSEALRGKLDDALEKLGDGKEFKIVNAIPWLYDYFIPLKIVPMLVGNYLSRASRKRNKPVRKCIAFGYRASTAIGMYGLDIINDLKARLDADPDFLSPYRKKETNKKLGSELSAAPFEKSAN